MTTTPVEQERQARLQASFDATIARGDRIGPSFVLTCQTFPADDNVVLDFDA